MAWKRVLTPLAMLPVACIASTLAVLQACSDPDPVERGNRLIDDTRPPPTGNGNENPPPPPDASGDGGAYADTFSPYPPDGYAPLEACEECACSPGEPDAESYCFGGATGRTTVGACDMSIDAGRIEVGCNRIPPECLPNVTCECLLAWVTTIETFPCYLVCTKDLETGRFTVYCPNP